MYVCMYVYICRYVYTYIHTYPGGLTRTFSLRRRLYLNPSLSASLHFTGRDPVPQDWAKGKASSHPNCPSS